MRKLRLLFLCLLLVTLETMAQRTVVSGTVTDNTTGRAIAGASVTAGGVAVVTNDDGYFMLKSDDTIEAITITHVGFRTKHIAVSSLNANSTIRLEPTAIQLKEVLVIADNAYDLVSAAIQNIPQNYSLQPELYHCFYRETAMKRQHYICVAEGVVDMYKTSYRSGNAYRDRVAISKGRRLLSAKASDTLSVKVLGGPVTPIQLDLVKNTGYLLNEKELDNYELKMEMPVSIADRMQYVVRLRPRAVKSYPLYYGKLYIDQETLAFTRAELSLDMSDRLKATEIMLVKKPLSVRFKPRELSLLVDYRQGQDGIMRLSYIRTTFRFNCDWRRRLFSTSFSAFCELVVTSTDSHDVKPISGRESFDQRDAFFDKVDYFRDITFWQDYNIIEPTESLDRAVHRLLKKY